MASHKWQASCLRDPIVACAAPADAETILDNLRNIRSHKEWCETNEEKWKASQQSPIVPGPEEPQGVAELVCRLISAGLKDKFGKQISQHCRFFRSWYPQGTAEMIWITLACNPDDAHILFSFLVDLARENDLTTGMDVKIFEMVSHEILIQAVRKMEAFMRQQLSPRLL